MIRLLAFAKINLTLSVLQRRPDGYHEIDSIVQTIDLADLVTVSRCDGGIRVENDLVGLQGRDVAEVAAERILQAKRAACGLAIGIEKRIPPGAGLGGGSSDAAAVLSAANRLIPPWLGVDAMVRLASEVGSDVPLFLEGGLVRMTGRGEVLQPTAEPAPSWFALLVPPIECNTGEVYRCFAELRAQDEARGAEGGNDLLDAALSAYPSLERYHEAIEEIEAEHAGMSGSGSTFFAGFSSVMCAESAAEYLRERLPEAKVFVCSATGEGHRIIEGDA